MTCQVDDCTTGGNCEACKPEAAAGPEPESPASAWLEGYKRGRIEAEAAAGPRRGHPCSSLCDQSQDLHYIAVQIPAAEAAAGPRDLPQHSPACAGQDDNADCICGVSEAYALGLRDGAAGPRDYLQQYWTDTGHIPPASPAPEVCPVCKLGWDRHLA